jgi:hypothetical protein
MRYNVNDGRKLAAGFSSSEHRSLYTSSLHRIGTSRYETALWGRSRLTSLDGQEATGVDIVHVSDLLRPFKFVVLYYTERINPDIPDIELSGHLESFFESTWKLWSRDVFMECFHGRTSGLEVAFTTPAVAQCCVSWNCLEDVSRKD